MSVLDALKKLLDEQLAAEGITPGLLDMVDLSIAYSPVIPFTGGGLDSAVDVRPWGFPAGNALPERFEVLHPLIHSPVDRESLKVMRARYLLARDAYYGPLVRQIVRELLEGRSQQQVDDQRDDAENDNEHRRHEDAGIVEPTSPSRDGAD